jgi:hypothetical protein
MLFEFTRKELKEKQVIDLRNYNQNDKQWPINIQTDI